MAKYGTYQSEALSTEKAHNSECVPAFLMHMVKYQIFAKINSQILKLFIYQDLSLYIHKHTHAITFKIS